MEISRKKRSWWSPKRTVLVGPAVGQVGERRTANQVTSLASRVYGGPRSSGRGKRGERGAAPSERKKRKRDRAKGGGCSSASCEPLLSGTSARCRVQVVPCSFSTFLRRD